MKTCGYVFAVLGTLSLIGTIIGGHSPIGPIFWIGLGIFLIHRADEKKEDKNNEEKWKNGES